MDSKQAKYLQLLGESLLAQQPVREQDTGKSHLKEVPEREIGEARVKGISQQWKVTI